jgi:hypothetical protein
MKRKVTINMQISEGPVPIHIPAITVEVSDFEMFKLVAGVKLLSEQVERDSKK